MGKKKKWEKMPFLFLFFELFPAESCFLGTVFYGDSKRYFRYKVMFLFLSELYIMVSGFPTS